MELFNYKIKFSNLGELYTGLKLNLVTSKQIIKLCQEHKVKECNSLLVQDLIVNYDSLFNFLKILKKDHLDILINEDSNYQKTFEGIPNKYFRIWQLNSLLNIKKQNLDMELTLDLIQDNFYFYNFPEPWVLSKIIPNSIENNNLISNKKLIANFIKYIDSETQYFYNTNKD